MNPLVRADSRKGKYVHCSYCWNIKGNSTNEEYLGITTTMAIVFSSSTQDNTDSLSAKY